jgi:tetratricopeptide (TPR) repeat protein
MRFIFLRYIQIFILTFGVFYARGFSCNEIDSVITIRYNDADYEIAHNMAKKNKDKEACDAKFYFNLGKVFKKFDDFNSTREMYNLAMKKSNEEDYKTINLEYKKLSFFSSQINFIQSIYASDRDKEKALNNYKELLTGNDNWDNGEPFVDTNQNMSYDSDEAHTDWKFDDIGLLNLYIADLYKNSENYTESIKYLKSAILINPYVKKYQEYINVISKLIAQKGNNYLRLGKLENAIEEYNLSLSIDSTEASIFYNLGNAYFEKEDYFNAIKAFKNVVKLDPDKFKAIHKSGISYQKMNLHEDAIVEFRKAITVIESTEEKFMSPYHSLGVSFMQTDLYEDAIQILNEVITLSPQYYKAYETLGVIHIEANDSRFVNYDLALEYLLEASKIKSDNYKIKFRLSQLYNMMAEENKENEKYKLMNKNLIEAKKYARQCLKLKKTYGGAYFELGFSELNLCNRSSSLKALKKAAKYDRRYRSEVKRIIKKMDTIMNHCQDN